MVACGLLPLDACVVLCNVGDGEHMGHKRWQDHVEAFVEARKCSGGLAIRCKGVAACIFQQHSSQSTPSAPAAFAHKHACCTRAHVRTHQPTSQMPTHVRRACAHANGHTMHAYMHIYVRVHICLLLVHMMRLAGMGKVWPRLAEDLDYTGWMVEQHSHDSEEGQVPRLPRLPRSLPTSNFSSPRAIFVNVQVALNLGPQRTTPSWTSGAQQHWSA